MRLLSRIIALFVVGATFIVVVELAAVTQVSPPELQSQQTTPELPKSDGSLLNLFVTMLGLIVVFSFVLYFVLKVYKQTIMDKRFGHLGPEIKVLGQSVIGPKKNLCVVNAFQHVLLLGVTENQINVLLDIPFESLNDDLRQALLSPTAKPEINFRKILERFSTK